MNTSESNVLAIEHKKNTSKTASTCLLSSDFAPKRSPLEEFKRLSELANRTLTLKPRIPTTINRSGASFYLPLDRESSDENTPTTVLNCVKPAKSTHMDSSSHSLSNTK